jgi:hypothetical protein
MTIFYTLRFETSPNPRIYNPSGTGWPGYTPGTGFPFRRHLRLAGLRFRYSTPPPHGILRRSHSQSYFATGGLPPISFSWRQGPRDHDQRSFLQQYPAGLPLRCPARDGPLLLRARMSRACLPNRCLEMGLHATLSKLSDRVLSGLLSLTVLSSICSNRHRITLYSFTVTRVQLSVDNRDIELLAT